MNTRAMKFAGLVLSAVFVLGCGQGPELVDRTQPNYVKKSDLTAGTWYIQDTVVGVPPTVAISFEGYQGPMEKVRFEVQEKHLVAYRSYEFLPGADPSVDRERSRINHVVTLDGRPYRGAPIAAWPITSHFDRIREYNPATGEQSNVLTENSSDRPWYERDFMRVNWGQQVIKNLMSVDADGRGSFNTYVQPVEGETGDDAVVFVFGKDDGALQYFDFTVRQYWEPGTVEYPGYGSIPYCWLNPEYDCRGAEVKVRTSVLRVDDNRVADYEPLEYDDHLNTKFGYFRAGAFQSRQSYDENYGSRLSGRLLYAARHNIWQRAHDDNGNVIPVQARTPRPIAYYLSDNYPPELLPAARLIEKDWDEAFRRAVAVPRGVDLDQVPQMFFVCANPVPAGAPAACGPEGLHVRMGDLRYNMLNWVHHPQMAGPLGYGPSSEDPETGEIIHAVANMYGAGVDSYAGQTLQVLDTLTGELSFEDLIAGKDVQDYLVDNRNPTDPRRQDGPAQSKQGLTSDATQKPMAFANVTGPLHDKLLAMKAQKSLPRVVENRAAVLDKLIALNPAMEQSLVDVPEVRAAILAAAPGEVWRQKLQSDEAFYRTAARQTLLRFDEVLKLENARLKAAAAQRIWLAEFTDDAFIQLARSAHAQFEQCRMDAVAGGTPDQDARSLCKTQIYDRVRNEIMRFVGAHEVGHTLGLQHNFAGSYDAINYQNGFWDLRKESIGVIAGGQRVLPLHPADLSAAAQPTQKQIDSGMIGLQYSTVMDYSPRWVLNSHGIGKYDAAAILFGYSGGGEPGWVEVFNETRANTDSSAYTDPNILVPTSNAVKPFIARGAHVQIPLENVETYSPLHPDYLESYHYTTIPFHFADRGLSFSAALEQGVQRMQSRSYVPWREMKGFYDAIEVNLQDYYKNAQFFEINGQMISQDTDWERALKVVTPVAFGNKVEVPYMFCSHPELGYRVSCNMFDSGADYFEMTRDWIERQNDYYAFSNFRRDRLYLNPIGVANGKLARYLQYLPNVYQHWFYRMYQYQFYLGYDTDFLDQYGYVGDPLIQNYWTMAVMDGVNHLMSEVTMPSIGYYGRETTTGRWEYLAEDNNAENTRFDQGSENELKNRLTTGATPPYTDIAYVPRGAGRSMFTLYDSQGYDFFRRINEVGHFWDHYGALIALMASEANIAGVDTTSDSASFALPYYLAFKNELTHTFSSIWLNETSNLTSTLIRREDGVSNVARPTHMRAERVIAGFEYPIVQEPVDNTTGQPEKIEASPTWSTRQYSQLFGMAFFNGIFSLSYAHENKVYKLGSGESVTPADGYEVITADDPFGGGFSYAALSKIGATELTAGVKAVTRTKSDKQAWVDETDPIRKAQLEATLREDVRILELMRGMYGIFGSLY